jgi:hypothetical protein
MRSGVQYTCPHIQQHVSYDPLLLSSVLTPACKWMPLSPAVNLQGTVDCGTATGTICLSLRSSEPAVGANVLCHCLLPPDLPER